MTDIFDLQSEFMFKAGQVVLGGNLDQANLYDSLIIEEYNEFRDVAIHNAESVKEACDIIVVAAGYLISILGTEKAKQAYDLVNESNMAKLKGKIEKREDGKVMKSDAWKKEIKEKLMADLKALMD